MSAAAGPNTYQPGKAKAPNLGNNAHPGTGTGTDTPNKYDEKSEKGMGPPAKQSAGCGHPNCGETPSKPGTPKEVYEDAVLRALRKPAPASKKVPVSGYDEAPQIALAKMTAAKAAAAKRLAEGGGKLAEEGFYEDSILRMARKKGLYEPATLQKQVKALEDALELKKRAEEIADTCVLESITCKDGVDITCRWTSKGQNKGKTMKAALAYTDTAIKCAIAVTPVPGLACGYCAGKIALRNTLRTAYKVKKMVRVGLSWLPGSSAEEKAQATEAYINHQARNSKAAVASETANDLQDCTIDCVKKAATKTAAILGGAVIGGAFTNGVSGPCRPSLCGMGDESTLCVLDGLLSRGPTCVFFTQNCAGRRRCNVRRHGGERGQQAKARRSRLPVR